MPPLPSQSLTLFAAAGAIVPAVLGFLSAWGIARNPRLRKTWRALCLASVFAAAVAALAGATVWGIS
jgi:hypothetical protein